MTVYELLRLLAILGWTEYRRIGQLRMLVHPARPGVQITLKGRPSRHLTRKELFLVLAKAGIMEGPK